MLTEPIELFPKSGVKFESLLKPLRQNKKSGEEWRDHFETNSNYATF